MIKTFVLNKQFVLPFGISGKTDASITPQSDHTSNSQSLINDCI